MADENLATKSKSDDVNLDANAHLILNFSLMHRMSEVSQTLGMVDSTKSRMLPTAC